MKMYKLSVILILLLSSIAFITCEEKVKEIEAPEQDEISKIEIRIGVDGELIKLTRVQEDSWNFAYREEKTISGEANTSVITRLLNEIEKLNVNFDRIATRNTDNYFKYGVDDSSGIILKIYTDSEEEPANTFIIGKSDIGGKFTFIRLLDKEPVYRTYGDYRNILNKKVNDYRNKSILDYEKDNIVKIEYTDVDGTLITLNKETIEDETVKETDTEEDTEEEKEVEIQWVRESDNHIYVTEKVNKAIQQISKLSTTSFVDYPSDELLNIETMFKVTYYEDEVSGEKYSLSILELIPKDHEISDVNQDTYLVKKDNQTNPLYLINKNTIDRLMEIRESDEEDKPEEETNNE